MSKFERSPVLPRATVPPPPTKSPESGALVQAAPKAATKRATKKAAKKATKKTATKKTTKRASTGKKLTASLSSLFVDEAIKEEFGEFSAEKKEDSMLIRRWNGSFWELMSDTAGIAEAVSWLRTEHPKSVSMYRAKDSWETLKSHLYKHKPFQRRNARPDHVVVPLLDGYLHVMGASVWVDPPDRRMGLTFQVKAKADSEPGRPYVVEDVPKDSLFGRFLASSLPDPALRALVQEQCAMSFLPNTHQTVCWWVGEGGAGKSTLAKLIENFHHSVATLDLHKLDEPHHLEALVDASFIRVDEVSQKGPWSEKQFKSIVSGDVFMINPKHKKNYTHRTTVYWMITSNQPPLIRDESDGVRRRIIPVPWLSSSRQRGFSESNLDEKILKNEPHVLLSWIVEGLQRFLRRGGPVPFTQLPPQVKELMTNIHRSNDNVETWFEDCEVIAAHPKFKLSHLKQEIYDAYAAYTEANGMMVLKQESFWIRFWRRPGLKSAGVVEQKITGRLPDGQTGRLRAIANLAFLPKDIADQKLYELDEIAIQRAEESGVANYKKMLSDPFGLDPNASHLVALPQYTDEEEVEVERLKELRKLAR